MSRSINLGRFFWFRIHREISQYISHLVSHLIYLNFKYLKRSGVKFHSNRLERIK